MATRRERKQLEALERVRVLHMVLNSDTMHALEDLQRIRDAYEERESDPWELSSGIKEATRAFFGEVEGVAHAMCQAAAEIGPDLGVELSEKDRLKLLESRRTRDGRIVPARLEPHTAMKLACHFYPQVFGANYDLDRNSQGWREFIELKEVRDVFTHPKELDHLTAINGLQRVGRCLAWFASEMMHVLAVCEEGAAGDDRFPPRELPDLPSFKPLAKLGPFFSREDHDVVRRSPAPSIGYFKEGVLALVREVGRAMEALNQEQLNSSAGQYAARNLVRTLDSNLQGLLSFVKKYIEDAASRSEIVLAIEEQELLASEAAIEDQLPEVVTLWSLKFGYGKQMSKTPRDRLALKKARALRDRLVHPRKVTDLRISLNTRHLVTISTVKTSFREPGGWRCLMR